MEGQEVTIGSSISTTGNMLVSCNKPYVLKVDGVVWSPVEVLTNADRYILSSSGFVEILVDDERVFFFRNSLTPDFTFATNRLRFREGNNEVVAYFVEGTYNQRSFPNASIDNVHVIVYPTGGAASVEGLEFHTSQGDASPIASAENYVQYSITNIDPSQYMEVKLGNVLLDFVLPFAE